jgi:hypothetical protein
MSPYQLVYEETCHLPVKLEFKAHWAIKRWNIDFEAAGEKRKMQLSELEEWREKAYHNSRIYKKRTKRWHGKRIKKKEFIPKDKVLLFNSRVRLFRHRAITLQNNEGTLFKVNGQRLKIFLEPNKPLEVVELLDFIIP